MEKLNRFTTTHAKHETLCKQKIKLYTTHTNTFEHGKLSYFQEKCLEPETFISKLFIPGEKYSFNYKNCKARNTCKQM